MRVETKRRRRGLTLIEVLIATIILAVAVVAVMQIFRGANIGIRKTDERRELRYYLSEIYAHVNRQPLHELWDYFGPPDFADRSLAGKLALINAEGKLEDPSDLNKNPLGFTQTFIDEMRRDGLGGRVFFEFYYRDEELRYKDGEPDPQVGLAHMQAGVASVQIYDLSDPEERTLLEFRQPVMCPMIVGRPGIQLSSCPALNDAVKCQYGPKLAAREGRSWTAADQADCS
jgi:prepilin-type N-terminal cleavage/methylation domain-containing protein